MPQDPTDTATKEVDLSPLNTKPLPVQRCCSSLLSIWEKKMIEFFKYPEGKSVMTWVDIDDDGHIEHNCIFCRKPFVTINEKANKNREERVEASSKSVEPLVQSKT